MRTFFSTGINLNELQKLHSLTVEADLEERSQKPCPCLARSAEKFLDKNIPLTDGFKDWIKMTFAIFDDFHKHFVETLCS
jgi:hypothetical protein